MSEDKNEKSVLAPRLRFPKFREAWTSSPMSDLYSFKGNNSLSRDKLNYEGGSLRNIHYGDIHTKFTQHFRVDAECVPYINVGESSSAIRPENYCITGDMVFADASEDMADIGKAIEIIDAGEVPLVSGLHTILARPNDGSFALGFGAYLFSSEGVRKQIQREAQGAKVLGLSASRLGNVQLHYPSKPDEQQKIADCLSSLDDLIAAETQKLDALKTHKKGLMQQLFPREGETVPRLRLPEFRGAGEWRKKPLAEVCTVLQGYGFPEELQGRGEGKFPFCKVSDISRAVADRGGLLDEATNYVGDDDLLKLRAKLIPNGATVFAKIGEALRLNRRAYVQKECLVDNNVTGLKAIDGLADDYFVYLLSQQIDLNRHCGGSVPSVNKSTLEEILVVVPDTNEQGRIATSLLSLDNLITAQSQKINALKTHKKGLMQQLFPVFDEART